MVNVQQVPGSGVTPNGARQTWNQNDSALANELNAHEAATIQAGAHGGTAGLGAVVNVNGTAPSLQVGPDASRPAAGTVGRVYIAQDTGRIYEDNGTNWQWTGTVPLQSTAPASPIAGLLWLDSTTTPATLRAYSGSVWVVPQTTPADGSVTDTKVAAGAAIAEAKLALASDAIPTTPSRRSLGNGAQQAAAGNDSRLSDSRVPMGPAGGDLGGTYPNPTIAKDGLAGTPTMRSLGTGAQQAAAGSDPRIVNALQATGGTMTGPLILQGDGTAALHPLALEQFQARTMKDTVRAATTAALPANTYANGVLTASANGALPTVDGVSLAAGDRLYVINEAAGANNGIYTVTSLGSATTPWTLTRATDADTSAKVVSGMRAHTGPEGTTQANTAFYLTTANPITLGTTALTFTKPPAGSVPPASTTVLGSVEVSTAPVAAATPIALGQNDPYLLAEINGLALIWNSATSLTVDTGAAYVPGLNRLLDSPNQITLTGMTFTANTWYFIYLFLNAGVPAVEYSTTPPVAFKGPARIKGPAATPDNTRRYLGAVRCGPTANTMLNFLMQGSVVSYRENTATAPLRVLAGGTATALTGVDCSGVIPPTSRLASLKFYNTATNTFAGIYNADTGNALSPVLANSILSISDVPLSATQQLQYGYMSAAPTSPGALYVDVLGYVEAR